MRKKQRCLLRFLDWKNRQDAWWPSVAAVGVELAAQVPRLASRAPPQEKSVKRSRTAERGANGRYEVRSGPDQAGCLLAADLFDLDHRVHLPMASTSSRILTTPQLLDGQLFAHFDTQDFG